MDDEIRDGGSSEQSPSKEELRRLASELRVEKTRARKLAEEIEQLKARQEDADLGIGDTSDVALRRLAEKLRRTEQELTEVSRVALRTDEDEELEPYLEKVLDDHPELIQAYPNRVRRLEAARVMARGLRASDPSNTRNSQERDNATPTRVHLSGGGPSASRRARSGDNDWADFQRKMRDPKLSSDEKLELAMKWEREHGD